MREFGLLRTFVSGFDAMIPLLMEIVYVLVNIARYRTLLVELLEKVSRERFDGAGIGSLRGD